VGSTFARVEDSIREGEIVRLNINVKRMINMFYDHSSISKYAVECNDFILKTEILLSEQLSMRVKIRAFVNPHGMSDGNKAAYMQQANNILVVKDTIHGQGAGTSDKALVLHVLLQL
jgi:hypothetical protein